MMGQERLYPIGIQTFSEIREGNYLYVDKTELVYRMTHSASKYQFLSRRIIATVPKTGSLPEVLRFVEQVRVKLRKMLVTCSSKQTRRGCAIVS